MMMDPTQQKQAEAILSHLSTTLRASPPEGLSAEDVDGFMERNGPTLFDMVEAFLEAKAAQSEQAPEKVGTPTPWGGAKGAPLEGDAIQEGLRIVTYHGEHGVIKKVHISKSRMTSTDVYGNVETYPTTIAYYADVLLDTGRVLWRTSNLWEEIAPPTQVIDDIKVSANGQYMSYREVWDYLKSAWNNIKDFEVRLGRARTRQSKDDWKQSIRKERDRYSHQFDLFKFWRDNWPDVDFQGFDPLLYRHMVLSTVPPDPGTGRDGMADLIELSQLKLAPEGWQTKWKIGASIRYFIPGEGRAGEAPPHRGVIERIQGHHATLQDGVVIPLWMLHFDASAPVDIETFDQPRWLIDIGSEMSMEGGHYPKRSAIAKAVKGYLANHGVAVSTRVRRGSMVSGVSLLPKGGGQWTSTAKAKLNTLLPTLNIQSSEATFEPWAREPEKWDPGMDYGPRGGGLKIPAEHVGEVAKLLARAMKTAGDPLNLLGEQRAVAGLASSTRGETLPEGLGEEAAASPQGEDCFEISFDLPPHGEVKVKCGKQGKWAVWHNIHAGGLRYGWNGKRWAKRMVPPEDILEEVRARGITVFGGGR